MLVSFDGRMALRWQYQFSFVPESVAKWTQQPSCMYRNISVELVPVSEGFKFISRRIRLGRWRLWRVTAWYQLEVIPHPPRVTFPSILSDSILSLFIFPITQLNPSPNYYLSCESIHLLLVIYIAKSIFEAAVSLSQRVITHSPFSHCKLLHQPKSVDLRRTA